MKTIFDIGLYDAADTAYYLDLGFRVVAVEANPLLVDRARVRLRAHEEAGRLVLVNAALAASEGEVVFTVSGDDLGSSSILPDHVASRNPTGRFTVQSLSVNKLLHDFGIPHFLKVDIEGADRLCVLALRRDARPQFLSFEVGEDVEELIGHAASIGYERFRWVSQSNFRELAEQGRWSDRIGRRLLRAMGYADPLLVRRAGRFFAVGHSSGPVPWAMGGTWYPLQEALRRWRCASGNGSIDGWYDLHAK